MTDRSARDPAGWIFYDRDCDFCRRTVRFWRRAFERRGFAFAALQEGWVRERLQLSDGELLEEMRVLAADGEVFGGADGIMHLAQHIRWARPLVAVVRIPGLRRLLRWIYRQVAIRRGCPGGECSLRASPKEEGTDRPGPDARAL